jgi:hypothetical protein
MERVRSFSKFLTCLILLVALQDCTEKKDEPAGQVVRGLRAYRIFARAESRARHFPSVLQPADLSLLSFEIPGQLKAVNLEVGQKVQ